MHPPSPVSSSEFPTMRTPTRLPSKPQPIQPTQTIIHSTRVRQGIFFSNPTMGRLRNAALRNGVLSPTKDLLAEKVSQSTRADTWKKNLVVELDESLEKGLRDYLGFKQTTFDMTQKSLNFPVRTRSSGSTKSQTISRKSIELFRAQPLGENVLVKDLMKSIEEPQSRQFAAELTGEKYQYVTFLKAPPKEYVKLLKLSNFDVTLIPSDSRRIIIEAMLRDYYLNLIPENSDFLICKNSQTSIYTILFTGRLVPVCKDCKLVARFEVSKDLGFQLVCSSLHCAHKSLYRSKLSTKTTEYLWSAGLKNDIERSLSIKEPHRRPIISKIIQSGKYKKADFSRVLLDDTSTSPARYSVKPGTATNIMNTMNTTGSVRSRFIIRGNFPSRSSPKSMEMHRSTTGESLMRTLLRSNNSPSPEPKDFRGIPVLKDFEGKGLFAKEKEEVSEEDVQIVRYEERRQASRNNRLRIQEEKSKGVMRFSLLTKKLVDLNEVDKLAAYAVKLDRKTLFKDEPSSSNLDDSFEDIHNMMSLLNKDSQKKKES